MKYIFDLDNTLVTDSKGKYENAQPLQYRIDRVNQLYNEGNCIAIWTARGANSGIDWYDFTVKQLRTFGIKYHTFDIGKPNYDIWVDDKAINASKFFE